MPSQINWTLGLPETADGTCRLLLVGSPLPGEDSWRAAGDAIGAPTRRVELLQDAIAQAYQPGAVVLVVPSDQMKPLLQAAHTRGGLNDASMVVVCRDEEEAAFWSCLVWDSVCSPQGLADSVDVVRSAIQRAIQLDANRQWAEDYQRRNEALTQDEAQVLDSVCRGRLNKQIATELKVSVRTIEQRRRRVFEKMGVDSAVPLATFRATVAAHAQPTRRNRMHLSGSPSPPQAPQQSAPVLSIGVASEQCQLAIS